MIKSLYIEGTNNILTGKTLTGYNDSIISESGANGLWEGWQQVKVTHIGTQVAGLTAQFGNFSTILQPNNTTRTARIEAYFPNSDFNIYYDGDTEILMSNVGGNTYEISYKNNSGNPQGMTIWFKYLSGNNIDVNTYFYYRNAQVEEKDHSTPYVYGTRPDVCNAIYVNREKTPIVLKLKSDSNAVTSINKELVNGTPPYESSIGLTSYRPLLVTIQPGEKLYAYPSSGSPNITVEEVI